MKQLLLFFFLISFTKANCQGINSDTANSYNTAKVIKDSRLDILAKKEADFNETFTKLSSRAGKGFRLMLLSTNDRPLAMKVRAQLLQTYPDQKIYMSFQPPNIKLKFGNFPEKEEAEKIKAEILKMKLITGNIYVIQETIEIKPDKNKEAENSQQ